MFKQTLTANHTHTHTLWHKAPPLTTFIPVHFVLNRKHLCNNTTHSLYFKEKEDMLCCDTGVYTFLFPR
jgi:hypothetical protein